MPDKPLLLLHICCAPCSPHALNILREEYDVRAFFYNPNIHPREEYELREKEIRDFSEKEGFPLDIGEYDDAAWRDAVRGLEAEPEGGARCDVCFAMRMRRTAFAARDCGARFFTTTLTVSPHKNTKKIFAAGHAAAEDIPGVDFVEFDFKKKDGFRISSQLSREHGFYRQNYCGCIHSRR